MRTSVGFSSSKSPGVVLLINTGPGVVDAMATVLVIPWSGPLSGSSGNGDGRGLSDALLGIVFAVVCGVSVVVVMISVITGAKVVSFLIGSGLNDMVGTTLTVLLGVGVGSKVMGSLVVLTANIVVVVGIGGVGSYKENFC